MNRCVSGTGVGENANAKTKEKKSKHTSHLLQLAETQIGSIKMTTPSPDWQPTAIALKWGFPPGQWEGHHTDTAT